MKHDKFASASGEDISIPVMTRKQDPNFAKPTKKYFNKRTNTFDSFDNYTGSALSRHMVVMPIQAADGGLVKLTTLAVNKGRAMPIPAAFVHDAIVSTGSGALYHRNAYNNIAIPQAIEEIAKYGERLTKAISEAEQRTFKRIEDIPYIGIGEDGDYPSMGALFDENWDKTRDNGPYHQRFLERAIINIKAADSKIDDSGAKAKAKDQWNKYKSRIDAVITDARKAGWKPEGTIDELARARSTVRPEQFRALAALAKDLLKISGPDAELPSFVANQRSRVYATRDLLKVDPSVKQYGIAQMTSSSGGKRVKV
jgi:hypothetical protein